MLSVKDISHYGGEWGPQRYRMRIMTVLSPYHTRGEVSIFCQTASKSRELRHVCQRTRYTLGGGGCRIKKAANPHLKTLHIKLWDSLLTCGVSAPHMSAVVWGSWVAHPPAPPRYSIYATWYKERSLRLQFLSTRRSVQGLISEMSTCWMCPFQTQWEAPETGGSISSRTDRSSVSASTLALLLLLQIYRSHLLQHSHPEPESWGDVFGSSQG